MVFDPISIGLGIGGLLGGIGGSGDTSRSEETSRKAPSAAKFLPQLFSRAQAVSKQRGVANVDPRQREALGLLETTARDNLGLGQPILDLGRATAAGEFLDPRSNPLFGATIDAATAPIFRQLMEQVLPALQSQAISEGAFTGFNRGGQIATSRATQQANEVAGLIAGEQFARERGFQNQAGDLLGQGFDLEQVPIDALFSAGATSRSFEQEFLDDKRKQLQFLASIFQPFEESEGTATSSKGGGISGIASGAVSGGLAGGQLGGLIRGKRPPIAGSPVASI